MPKTAFETHLRAAQRGDEEAFAALWQANHPPLLRYLRVLAGEVAEDVASETWLQVVGGLRRFRGDEAGFRAWIFTIARNKLTDWRRYENRRPVYAIDDVETARAGSAGTAGAAGTADPRTVDDEALERISTHRALRLIAVLPQDQAEIVLLRVVAGLDVAAVADIVGKRPGAVRVTCHRALRRLHDLVTAAPNAAGAAADQSLPRSGVTR
jgi:RNA polymerase sigma-70 factor (ECF subfamily)